MSSLEKKVFILINLVVSIQGIIYFIFKYFFQIETEFGVRPHGMTSTMLHLHIILVPLLVLMIGYFLKVHIIPKLLGHLKNRKISGLMILSFIIISTLSGYLLQFGFNVELNSIIAWLHISVSFLWFFVFLWHIRFNFK